MNTIIRRFFFYAIILGAIATLGWPRTSGLAQETGTLGTIYGRIIDTQDQPVREAHIRWQIDEDGEPLAETTTQDDGTFTLALPETFVYGDSESEMGQTVEHLGDTLILHIERPHFESAAIEIESGFVEVIKSGGSISLSDTILIRRISPAFWITTAIFVAVLVLIATGKLHNTLAALLGTSLIYAISYLGRHISENLFIFDFDASLEYIDWNVIFLIMGMMIVIAVVERTGIFQWLAFIAYRSSGGRVLILLPILMIITGVASAFLDNVTTMLLMTPITIQIAISMGVNPLAFLIPEVMASNVMGISTLIGTPTNILIGSYAKLSFNDFLVNLTPGVILAIVGLVIYCNLIYRKELAAAREPSPFLMEQLAERGKITEPEHLKKAGWVGLGMLILFMFGEKVHLLPAVTALIGATALMVWIKPDIEEMIEAVDWTTLVFFMTLFITVGAIQEVGLISFIADFIGKLVGENLTLAMLVVVWFSAVLSTVVANIPFTAAMLPVIGYLSATIPGAQTKVLFYCISVGSAMGGNGSLIGASANMVTSGIAERAGYQISYMYFLKKGFPALLITVGLATLWLLIRF
ncbi:MAG: ArsB/NhaD family transporter [Chloroflexi bacterium]|nr:ArsB/NhaD family transporter [Chloroflexota bacterium]